MADAGRPVNLELLVELDGGASTARIDEVLATVGLAARGGDRVNGYSSGMRQRLGIAACLLRGPRLLLLDEPTAGLDPGGVREIAALSIDAGESSPQMRSAARRSARSAAGQTSGRRSALLETAE